jgi:SAM-dependent methyltransferase
MSSDPNCAACLCADLRYFGSRSGYSYVRCANCGSFQLSPIPTKEEFAVLYRERFATEFMTEMGSSVEDGDVIDRYNDRYHTGLLDILSKQSINGQVLDLGCGFGGMLAKARARGFDARGVDLSPESVKYCQSRGLPAEVGDLRSLRGRRFGAIIMSFVFEHQTEYDQFLSDCRDVLAPSGVIVSIHPTAHAAYQLGMLFRLGVKRIRLPRLFWTFYPPWHTVIFSNRGISALAERCGFKLVGHHPAPIGRHSGIKLLVQYAIEAVNLIAVPIFGNTWMLIPAHIAVLKMEDVNDSKDRPKANIVRAHIATQSA